ncbi:MAG: DUF4881 domain-containing protein [Deltaproteobacteria bacterium]|nr:DUF4881 domain-containing protein [Deltaproteobacteria bacterium]
MANKRLMILMALIVPLGLIWGCSEYGKVDQGRAIAFDKEKGEVTLIRDKANDAQHPDYTILPPFVYKIPADRHEMGPEPKVGLRMKLDVDKNEIHIYDVLTNTFKTIVFTPVSIRKEVAKDDPEVFDKAAKKAKKFPVIDPVKKTITVFSGRQKVLATFKVPDEDFAREPYTWEAGDEIRVYYHQEGVAQRLMNVSKTDIFKK